MKRLSSICIILSMLLLFSGCRRLRRGADPAATSPPMQTQTTTVAQTPEPTQTAKPSPKPTEQGELTPSLATPDEKQVLSDIISDMEGLEGTLKDLDEPEDGDLLIPD